MKQQGLMTCIAAAVMLSTSAGCGTVASFRLEGPERPYAYGGVRYGMRVAEEEGWVASPTYWPILDVPLSALVDTLLLPVTLPFEWCAVRRRSQADTTGVS